MSGGDSLASLIAYTSAERRLPGFRGVLGFRAHLGAGAAAMQKRFDIAMAKPLGASDRMTGQSAPPYHPVNRHFGDLKHFGELTNGVELRLCHRGILSHYKHLPLCFEISKVTIFSTVRYQG
jgi:hypothetical protein